MHQSRRPITSICINEQTLFAGGRDGTILEFSLQTSSLSRTFTAGHTKGITSLCASGSRLFSSSEDGSVIIWNIVTGTPTRTIRGHDGYVTAVCVSPEGRLYSGGADRMINEWDPVTGRRQWILTGHTRWVLALCAANNRLYSGGNDHTIRVWDMTNGRCLFTLEEHSDWVFSLCLGRDLLYSSSRDGSVKVWDTSSGQCLRTLRGHGDTGVRAVCIAAGRLFSAGDDKAIVEWDVKAGKAAKTLGGHFGAVACLSAGYDGKLYSGSGDCTVRVWEIVPPPASSPPTPPMSPMTEATAPRAPTLIGDRRHTVNGRTNSTTDANNHTSTTPTLERRQTTLSRSASRPISGLFDSFTIPPEKAPGAYDSQEEDVESIREQLAKAQELLAKQNKLKFRLKGDLTLARTELAAAKADISAAQEGLARLSEVEEELAAAKELLVMYKTELTLAQEAHISALDYIMKQSDSHFLQIELDLASVRHLLESPWTPLFHEDDGLEGYMPPKVVKRCWESDEEWDSDVEVPEGLMWWRGPDPYGIEMGAAGASEEDEKRRKIKEGAAKEIDSSLRGRKHATDDELVIANGLLSVRAPSRKRSDGSLSPRWSHEEDKEEGLDPEDALWRGGKVVVEKAPQPLSWHVPGKGTDEADPNSFEYVDDDEDDLGSIGLSPNVEAADAESALWNGPVRSAPKPAPNAAKWHEEPESEEISEAASSALWKGPVKKRSESQVGSRTGLPATPPLDAESALWNGQVKSVGMGLMADENLDAVVWNGKVKSSKRSSLQGSNVGEGSVVSGVSARRRKASNPKEDLSIDTGSSRNQQEDEAYVVVGSGKEGLGRSNSTKKAPAASGFGDNAVVPPPPVNGTNGIRGVQRSATVNGTAGTTSSSWFRPLRSWVESIGEQLTVQPPPNSSSTAPVGVPRRATTLAARYNYNNAPMSPSDQAAVAAMAMMVGDGETETRLESSRERARREMRERDEEARRLAGEMAGISVVEEEPLPPPPPTMIPPPFNSVPMKVTEPSKPDDSDIPTTPATPPPPPRPIFRRPSESALPKRSATIAASTLAPSPTTTTHTTRRASVTARSPITPGGDPTSALERMASAFENALETAIENPWSLVPGWVKQKEDGKRDSKVGVESPVNGVSVNGVSVTTPVTAVAAEADV
ncbi:hypothetical protein HDU97_005283 [Phlyctochytrium planicorne]|nr:hypothetical protein HDU97_005283 [Phlyctochytrium planicorne]